MIRRALRRLLSRLRPAAGPTPRDLALFEGLLALHRAPLERRDGHTLDDGRAIVSLATGYPSTLPARVALREIARDAEALGYVVIRDGADGLRVTTRRP